MAQLANCSRQPIGSAHKSHIVPHDVLNCLHVALNQRGVRFSTQTTLIPGRNVFKLWLLSIRFLAERCFDFERRSIPPDQPLQKRGGSEPVRAVYTSATDLTDRIQVADRRTRPF